MFENLFALFGRIRILFAGMSVIDFILNLLGLLLWVNWRSGRAAVKLPPPGVSLANSIRRTEPSRIRPWVSLAGLGTLLLVRAIFYWNIGPALNWTASIYLGVISLPWRSDLLDRMLLFSGLSFGLALGIFYSCLLLLSIANGKPREEQSFHRFVRFQLGFLHRLPAWVKLLLPFPVAMLCWAALVPLFTSLGIIPEVSSQEHLWEQGMVLGMLSYLPWGWVLMTVFGLHLVNSYIYLGDLPFWEYVSRTAQRLLSPLKFLRLPKVDLSPIAGMAVVFLAVEFGLKPLAHRLFERLPL